MSLSRLRQDNLVSLARERLWRAQTASLQPSTVRLRHLGKKSAFVQKKFFGKLPKARGLFGRPNDHRDGDLISDAQPRGEVV